MQLGTLRRHAWAKVRNAGSGISIAGGVGLRCTVDTAEDDSDDSKNCDPSPDLGPAHVHSEFERKPIQSRCETGIAKARANGKKFGRPSFGGSVVCVREANYDGIQPAMS
jgi:DNA invertase Pin-like site-specific DNA recombinase